MLGQTRLAGSEENAALAGSHFSFRQTLSFIAKRNGGRCYEHANANK
jgi:hypothetical protein